MKLSIIIPTLNEAEGLPQLLADLYPLCGDDTEIVIADGGSHDGTAALARRAGLPCVEAPRGRARQMNAGAALASGELLLFLHADTRLPPGARAAMHAAIQSGAQWGRFDVRIAGQPFMLKIIGRMINLRSRLSGIATGDQAIFITRRCFNAIGGFPDQPLMEDIELSARLLRAGCRPACLRQHVLTSGRRWESRGVWRTILLMWQLRWAYWRGVPASQLAARYR
jgi:rSAM/selenodomain-associated transferase 2